MLRLARLLCLIAISFFFYTSFYAQVYPQRIISLGSAITEELYLLGVGDRIIGNTIYCNRPQEAKSKIKVGTVTKVDLEKIISLKPDLILATSLTDRRQLRKMEALKLNVVEIPAEINFSEICKNFLKLAKLVGKEKKAEEILKDIERKAGFIQQKAKNLPKPKVMVQIGAKPLFLATKRYFVHDFLELAGGINIAKEAKSGLYSREEILRQNPDVIIITTMGIIAEEEKINWQKFKSINAVKNNRIYVLDAYKVCSPTPVSFVVTLKEIFEILHPEVKLEENLDEEKNI